jgi:hypothetical protein
MFERNPADMTRTLGEMYKAAFNRSNSNQAAAKEKFVEYAAQYKRYKPYDLHRLADRVVQCGQSGARLDLTDP